jgi:hypothetical protein
MVSEKVFFSPFLSFPRKPESSQIKQFWAPASSGATAFLTFYEIIKFEYIKKISFFNGPFREGNWNGSVSLLNWRNAGSVTRIFKNSGRNSLRVLSKTSGE